MPAVTAPPRGFPQGPAKREGTCVRGPSAPAHTFGCRPHVGTNVEVRLGSDTQPPFTASPCLSTSPPPPHLGGNLKASGSL